MMENQHRKIKGYRELNQEEIDLMNRIKAAGTALLNLQAELAGRICTDSEVKLADARQSVAGMEYNGYPYTEHTGATDECHEFRRHADSEPARWAQMGKDHLQQAVMCMVRAVAQPAGI